MTANKTSKRKKVTGRKREGHKERLTGNGEIQINSIQFRNFICPQGAIKGTQSSFKFHRENKRVNRGSCAV